MSEESEREAYEQQRYEQYCYDKQQEEAALEAAQEEDARRLARYDEATLLVNLLLSVVAAENTGGQYYDLIDRAEAFLAAEPKEGR